MLFFIALTYLFSEYKYSRGVTIYFGFIGAISLISLRLAVRNALRNLRRKGYNLRYSVVIGEGPAVETLIWKLKRFPEIGIQVLGVIAPPGSDATAIQGVSVVGDYSKIIPFLREKKPDQVLIALPRRHADELDSILRMLKDEPVDIQLIPDIHDYVTLGCAVEDFDGLPIVRLNDSPLDGPGSILKRITDFLMAILERDQPR
jgi:putative colanic acid biosynthesis UDP-glucose lipid carrier transferase